jgi:hypothetical protein
MSKPCSDIENLFTRLAHSLDSSVAPYVADHYATMQLKAAREMLLNLGVRVEWRRADIEASERVLREALATLSQPSKTGSAASAAELRAALARIIEQVYDAAWDGPKRDLALTAIWRVIRFEFDAEAQRIKTGMFT